MAKHTIPDTEQVRSQCGRGRLPYSCRSHRGCPPEQSEPPGAWEAGFAVPRGPGFPSSYRLIAGILAACSCDSAARKEMKAVTHR